MVTEATVIVLILRWLVLMLAIVVSALITLLQRALVAVVTVVTDIVHPNAILAVNGDIVVKRTIIKRILEPVVMEFDLVMDFAPTQQNVVVHPPIYVQSTIARIENR